MKKKICVFTGTRAEYGLLRPLLKNIQEFSDYFRLQLIVSGMHLSPEFGLTYREIENDGFKIDDKIEILLSSDSSVGVSKSIGLGIISFTESLKNLSPDILIVLGDRFESFAIATVAYTMKIPIVHLYGGETTEGAIDEGFRHSITKMSYLHFTSTEKYRKRVIQLGEDPSRVFNVGAIGLDNIRNLDLLTKDELSQMLNFDFNSDYILFTYHPSTINNKEILKRELREIFSALEELLNLGYGIIITKSNADEGGRLINKYIDDFHIKYKKFVLAVENLGTLMYLSVMKYAKCVVGNSSSGIVEAPSLKVPTINIGDRQKGRERGNSIIDCEPRKSDILEAIKMSELIDKNKIENPYDQGGASEKIISVLKDFLFNKKIDLKKKFFDIEF